MTDEIFDVIVIGAGPAGENIAQYAREGGDLRVALIERELVGGECSYYACIPSKALLRPIEVAATAADLDGIRGVQLDAMALLRRRDRWISGYDDAGQAAWVASAGLTLVRGQARLIGERRVAVVTTDGESGQGRTLEARHAVVLATGSEAILPPLYAAALPWSSRDATGVVEVPRRLAIVGGGVVACEAAGWLAALGSEVILLVRDQRLLGRVESFAADLVLAAMRERGIDVRLGVEVTGCRRPEARDTGLGRIHGGTVELDVDGTTLRVDEVLVAVGRRPRLGDVGLEAVGLDDAAVRAGAVPDWLVAVGDASGEPQLTHWGKYRGRVLGEAIAARVAGRAPAPLPPLVPLPQAIFTDPPIGSVGMTYADAVAAGVEVAVARVPWAAAAGGALARDTVRGAAQIIVDRATGCLVGATFVGLEAPELIHAATVAIVGRIPVDVLRHAVPSYPTASELWLRMLEELPRQLRDPR